MADVKTKIFHTVNNGFYFKYGSTGVFFDGIHKGREVGFSDAPKEIVEGCYNCEGTFKDLKALIFTHMHSDHFDKGSAESIVQKNGLYIYAPGYSNNNVPEMPVQDGITEIHIGDMQIFAVRTVHDGAAELRKTPHVSFVINTDEESFFMAGDAVFQESETEKFRKLISHRNTAVIANPYQLHSDIGRSLLNELKPEKTILCHMPFEKDDVYNINMFFRGTVKRYSKSVPGLFVPGYNEWVL